MARKKKPDRKGRYWNPSLVEEVLTVLEVGPTELAERLTKIVGVEVSKQQVYGWRVRGQFPPEIIPYIHRLTRLPLSDLIARNRPRFKIPTQR